MNQIRLAYSRPDAKRDDEKDRLLSLRLPRPSPLKSRNSLDVKISLLLTAHPELAPFVETLVDELLKD